jgi:hypothetical protein
LGSDEWEEIRLLELLVTTYEQEHIRIEVTSENFGELLIQGLEEAVAFARGEVSSARVVRRTRGEASS